MAMVPQLALPIVSPSAGVYDRSIDMWREGMTVGYATRRGWLIAASAMAGSAGGATTPLTGVGNYLCKDLWSVEFGRHA